MERFTSSKHGPHLANIVDNIDEYVGCCGNGYTKCAGSPRTQYSHLLADEMSKMIDNKTFKNRIMLTNIVHSIAQTELGSASFYPTAPNRILDAPGLINDFYIRILDWNQQDILAISLGPAVYLWNAVQGSASLLTKLESGYVSSVKWIASAKHNVLSLGTSDGTVQLWDVETSKLLRTIKHDIRYQHEENMRTSSLAWNSYILTSGNRCGDMYHTDVRSPKHYIVKVDSAHNHDVCGLEWSPDGKQLASGGNDNVVKIWEDISIPYPLHTIKEHTAAVKAISWNPEQRRVLATGGGRNDQTLKLWSTTHGECLKSVDTGAQITDLLWSIQDNYRDIVTSHGYTVHHLQVWHGSLLAQRTKINGEYGRVICMAGSPDGKSIASISSDESLRFWEIGNSSSLSQPQTCTTPISSQQRSTNTPSSKLFNHSLCSPPLSPPRYIDSQFNYTPR